MENHLLQPTCLKNIKTNVAKMFLQSLDTHLPPANKLHKIFNCYTVKASYSCTQNISHFIKGLYKVIQIKWHHQLELNCPIKTELSLNGDCRKEDVTYKGTALTTFQSKKVYLGLKEGERWQRYYNHTQSFRNENYFNSKTLSSYVWKIMKTKKGISTLVWEIIRIAPSYTNITQRCSLCLNENLAMLMSPNQSELLNKRSELLSKCQHENKFLLKTFNSNDWRKYLYFLMSSSQLQ